MEALKQSNGEASCKALLGFSLKALDAEDSLGQVQPGSFSDPAAMCDFLANQKRYRTLMMLEEYKVMGPPNMSNMSRGAEQKLLVRRDGANWEEFFITMQLIETELAGVATKRWVISSIYKQGFAP